MKRFIVGLGEALWDVLPEGKKIGGAPANFTYHAAQYGLDTLAISALGNDALGDEIAQKVAEKNLNVMMPRVPFPTGTVQVELDAQGVPTYDIKEDVAWDNPLPPKWKKWRATAEQCAGVRWLNATR